MFNPHRIFAEIKPLPLVCSDCDFTTQMEVPTDEQLCMLIDASYFISLRRELVLLQRTQELFDKFPTSLHPVKMAKSILRTKEAGFAEVASGPDSEFENALQVDQGLLNFLCPPNGTTSFYLPARLKWVEAAVRNHAKSVQEAFVQCPVCEDGFLLIRDEHFNTQAK